MSYTLIERKELTSAASSISFDGIPQIYTDLIVKMNLRYDGTPGNPQQPTSISFNGSGTSKTSRYLRGAGSDAISLNYTEFYDWIPTTTTTSNTFSNGEIYIPNYTGSTNKSASIDSVIENNGTAGWLHTGALLWSNTAPITSITIAGIAYNLVAGSSISLYGINRQQAIGAPKAVGGQISFANGYWVHSFTGSGTFLPQENMVADALVIAGGGGGGSNKGGGGGAGGYLEAYGMNLQKLTNYSVVIGSGGSGGLTGVQDGYNGNISSFLTTAPIGGGGGAADKTNSPVNGLAGGSGGGGARGGSGGAGTSGQGNAGGSGEQSNSPYGGGGGGGAGAVGQSSSGNGGNGGIGRSSTMTGSAVFRAGGGGGSIYTPLGGSAGTGGLGGGGNGGTASTAPTPGTANTGGGGGAWNTDHGMGAAGGSGIVIIRYKA